MNVEAKIESGCSDIFESNAEAIVNAVNCVGVMGKGLALQFKNRFPENFATYKDACNRNKLQLGAVLVYDHGEAVQPRFIINFPSKNHWRDPSKIDYIESGLVSLAQAIKTHNISSIAVPALGCGLGGLKWEEVRPRIVEALSPIEHLTVYLLSLIHI